MGNTAVSEQADKPKDSLLGLFATVLWAFILAFALRTFLFQPFTIPSASMEPNLIEGDYLITSKYSVGYGKFAADPLPFPVKTGRLFERSPKRGDIIVFKPQGSSKYFIKRLVGLPGDDIQMINGELYINDELQAQAMTTITAHPDSEFAGAEVRTESFGGRKPHLLFEHVQNHDGDNTKVYSVPDNHYFMMGDNRDHSGDSRMPARLGGIGYVPAENIIGRAEFVLVSAKPDFVLFKPWTWGEIRGDRLLRGLR